MIGQRQPSRQTAPSSLAHSPAHRPPPRRTRAPAHRARLVRVAQEPAVVRRRPKLLPQLVQAFFLRYPLPIPEFNRAPSSAYPLAPAAPAATDVHRPPVRDAADGYATGGGGGDGDGTSGPREAGGGERGRGGGLRGQGDVEGAGAPRRVGEHLRVERDSRVRGGGGGRRLAQPRSGTTFCTVDTLPARARRAARRFGSLALPQSRTL